MACYLLLIACNLKLNVMRRAVLTVALGLMLSAGFVGCSASGEVTEEREMSVEQRERINPSNFIAVNAQYDHDVIGASDIRGTLYNKEKKTN